jgi:hypothetical protein
VLEVTRRNAGSRPRGGLVRAASDELALFDAM